MFVISSLKSQTNWIILMKIQTKSKRAERRKYDGTPSRLPKINEQVVKDVATTNFSMEN